MLHLVSSRHGQRVRVHEVHVQDRHDIAFLERVTRGAGDVERRAGLVRARNSHRTSPCAGGVALQRVRAVPVETEGLADGPFLVLAGNLARGVELDGLRAQEGRHHARADDHLALTIRA
jgi:hypothetical protein